MIKTDNRDIAITLGACLKRLRERKHLTQASMAEIMKCTLRQYQKYESGEANIAKAAAETVLAAAEILDVTVENSITSFAP